jgi:hypothetical protein
MTAGAGGIENMRHGNLRWRNSNNRRRKKRKAYGRTLTRFCRWFWRLGMNFMTAFLDGLSAVQMNCSLWGQVAVAFPASHRIAFFRRLCVLVQHCSNCRYSSRDCLSDYGLTPPGSQEPFSGGVLCTWCVISDAGVFDVLNGMFPPLPMFYFKHTSTQPTAGTRTVTSGHMSSSSATMLTRPSHRISI